MSADDTDDGPDRGSVLDTWREWYHVPVLALLALYMFWVRVQPYDNFVRDDRVYFSGNDAYYHFRTTMYSVENWPSTSFMDIWTQFPTGTTVGQFGTLFDLVVATVALIVGAGSPTEQQVATIAVLTPPVLGALCLLPVFYLGRRFTKSTIGGLGAALTLAVLPTGSWVTRTTAGFYDHHVAETFLMTTAILTTMVAISVVQREKPVYEQVLDGDWEGLKPSITWSLVLGVSYAVFIWAWPPGVIAAGLLGIYFLFAILLEVFRGESPEPIAFAGAVGLGSGGLLAVPFVRSFGFGTTTPSLLQVMVPLVVAIGCVFLAWLARQWESRDLEPWKYGVTVGAIGAGSILLLVVLPGFDDLLGSIWTNIQRSLLATQTKEVGTIREARSMFDDPRGRPLTAQFFTLYGFTAFTGLLSLFWVGIRTFFSDNRRSEHLLVLIWTVFVTMMAISQIRFHYYLVAAVAVLNGWLIKQVVVIADLDSIDSPFDLGVLAATAVFAIGFPMAAELADIEFSLGRAGIFLGAFFLLFAIIVAADYLDDIDLDMEAGDLQSYQILVVAIVALVVVVPIASPAAQVNTASDFSEGQQPGGVTVWSESTDYLEENTPKVGNYGGASNADTMSYYGPYETIDDYQYPEGAYGVLSWWDYGHWITVEGERIPVANPFQSGAVEASEFLQTDDEERANLLLDAMPAEDSVNDRSNEELRGIVDNRTEEQAYEDTRYVMIDHQMAGGKFGAITQWSGPNQSAFEERQEVAVDPENPNQTQPLRTRSERYEESMLYRLYYQDASELQHYRLVHETDDYAYVGSTIRRVSEDRIRGIPFQSFRLANLDRYNGTYNQDVANFSQGLRFANLQRRAFGGQLYNGRILASVKTFERVEGATLVGDAPDSEQVRVSVSLETNTGRPSRYTQTAQVADDGTFEVTVPYATDDDLGPSDGYADSAVNATGEYEITALDADGNTTAVGTAGVPGTAVVDGEQIDVTLEEPQDDGNGENGAEGSNGENGADDSGNN